MKTKVAGGRKTQVAIVLGPKTEALIAELAAYINITVPGVSLRASDVVGGMVNDSMVEWVKNQLGRDIGPRWNHFE
jgi:hypothetical protein